MTTREESLAEWVADEQENLWDRLRFDIDHALNDVWSIAASCTAARIVQAARLVGPTPRDAVPWALDAGGVYDELLELGRLPHPARQTNDDAWVTRTMSAYGTPQHHRNRYSKTILALRADWPTIQSELLDEHEEAS